VILTQLYRKREGLPCEPKDLPHSVAYVRKSPYVTISSTATATASPPDFPIAFRQSGEEKPGPQVAWSPGGSPWVPSYSPHVHSGGQVPRVELRLSEGYII